MPSVNFGGCFRFVVKCRGNDGLRRSTQQPALQLHDAGIKHDRSAKNRMESGHGDKISGDMTPNSPKPTVAVSSLVPVRIAHQASGALEPTSFTSDSPVLSDGRVAIRRAADTTRNGKHSPNH